MHCGYADDSVTCFTDKKNKDIGPLFFYVDGEEVDFMQQHYEKLNNSIHKYRMSLENLTTGPHLLVAKFDSIDRCGNGFQPPSYSAVIHKKGNCISLPQ